MTIRGINKEVESAIESAKAKMTLSQMPDESLKHRQQTFDVVIRTAIGIGNKKFGYVPIELLYADKRFQRVNSSAQRKINNIAMNFDENLMDALRVSVHEDELRFSVIDGFHRLSAAIIAGIDMLECELLFLSKDPDERLAMEAKIFSDQDNGIERLKPVQKHNANLINNVIENVILQRCLDVYKDHCCTNNRYDVCGLTGFVQALRTTKKKNGEELLAAVFDVIFHSGWNTEKRGLGNDSIILIRSVLELHWDRKDDAVKAMISYFSETGPKEFFAMATAAYPKRKVNERNVMLLENIISRSLGIEPVYTGGNLRDYHVIVETLISKTA